MSSFSIGQMNQLGNALEAARFIPPEITDLGQSASLLIEFRGVLHGTHEIRPIDHTIDLSVPCELPFNAAERISPAKSGVVKIKRCGDDLFLEGEKINLFLSEKQKKSVHGGHELRTELEAKGGNVSAKVLDLLVEHPELWPESWKKDSLGDMIYVFFWDDIFCDPTDGSLCVRYGFWREGKVVSRYHWLGHVWHSDRPTASLAS